VDKQKYHFVDEQRHYPNAPITEAIIDLRVELPDSVTVEELADVNPGEEGGYPNQRNHIAIEGHMDFGEQVGSTARQIHMGYLFLDEDEKQIFQARLDGFSFSRLAPYDRWETFSEEARRLWNEYRAVAQPYKINSVGLRYINRLDLPMPMRDLKDFLRTVPEVSSDLPQELNGYLMQLQIPQEDLGATLLLNEALVPPPEPQVSSVLLDISIVQQAEHSLEEEDLWEVLAEFRVRKNRVFEACITNNTRELFY